MRQHARRDTYGLRKLVLIAMLCTAAPSTYAAGEILECNYEGTDGYGLGTLEPSQDFDLTINGSCSVAINIPYGVSFTYSKFDNIGITPKVAVKHIESGLQISQQAGPNPNGPCLPSSCMPLAVGTALSYGVSIKGKAPTVTGRYMTNIRILVGSINTSQVYGQKLRDLYISYTVSKPSCTLISARDMNVSFGTISSNNFASTQQYANVQISCPNATQITASLTPVQQAIEGQQGVSATTLQGLSIATTWADANAAVIFGYPRSMSLKAGNNLISLGFRPVLQSSISPTGAFTSQYTLNVVYL